MVAIEEPGGRCSGEVDKLRLDSLREERRESWTRDDRPLAAAWTVEHHRWCLVWLRAGWLVGDRNHKRNFKRVTVLAQVRGPAQITRMQREEDALGRCQPGPEPRAWDDAKESPPGWARYLIFGVQSTRRGTAQQLERPAAVNRDRSSPRSAAQGTFLTAPFLPGAEARPIQWIHGYLS